MSEWEPGHFAAYLDAAMSNANIKNDAELARLSGVNQTQIGNWRRGTARPSMRLLRQVAEALRVPPNRMYVLAGWLQADEPDQPDMTTLPPEILDLIALYESMTTVANRKLIREHIEIALRGLKASTPEAEPEQTQRRPRKRAS